MNEFLTTATLIGIAHSGVRLATPYLFAATGEMFGQRSGVLNLGVEGVMLMGAFAAYYAVFLGGDPWLGVLAALAVGALMGLLMALISVTMQAEQGISGIGLTLFGLGLSSLLLKVLVGSPISIEGFPVLRIPVLSDIPLVGPVLFDHDVLVYLAYLMVPVSIFLLNRTTWGLKIRAVGQNPEAADSLGVRVNAVRYGTVIFGSALAGLAGASLSIGLLNIFQENMTNGIGFIAVALVYFGGWRPLGVLAGALLFSTVSAFQLWMQVLGVPIPSDLAVMLPYVLTIVVLAVGVKQIRQPAALTKPYERGE
ncbi:MAG: ABC transporter permease [Caldilinea sp.]|nr:ABC transporter permease [Caldilinea sp.]MCB0041697.1 ABC transporter permease [Caldilinea sp.]MCB0056392.1 ABC transporter permease [Caldilineaceae bacterium]HRW50184.1 ABC transporter permease [Caldilinea sp.]